MQAGLLIVILAGKSVTRRGAVINSLIFQCSQPVGSRLAQFDRLQR